MSKKKWEAFVIKGTMIPWTEIWDAYNVELESVEPESIVFDATIKYSTICKGYGSGCKVFFKDTERTYVNKKGETYPVSYGVFLADVDDIINKLSNGIFTGKFTICKRGQDYGIKLIE